MKKGIFFYIYYSVALIVVLVNCFFWVKNNIFIKIENVPDGEYQFSVDSPDELTELKVYFVDMQLGHSVRVSATDAEGTKNIYWQTDIETAKIKWKNNNEVVINGISIDLAENEYFDCRSIRSIFNDGLMGR